jgi:hypothetical protein
MASKISSIKRAILFLSLGLFLSSFALTAFAQEEATAKEPTKWRKKPNYAFKLGAFFPSVNAQVRVDGGETVDAEDDLLLDNNATTFRLDGDVRIAGWFALGLGYYAISQSNSQVINKDIQIGDTVFPVNQTLNTKLTNAFYNVDLKFYLINKPRLDFGVYAGVYWSKIKLNVDAQELDRRLIEFRQASTIIPSVGLHFSYTVLRNLYFYGKAGYFYIEPSKRTKFESATIDLNLDYYFWKFLGIGVKYEYSRFDLDLDVADYHGNLRYDINGFQAYATIGF